MADVQARDDTDVVNPGDPIRLDPEATQKWRDNAPSTDIGSLLGPTDDKSISGLTAGLKSAQAAKVAGDERLSREFDATAARDKAYRERAFAAEGVSASEMPRPWDAEKEHKKFESDPIQGFGSAGGIFAMVASAFTKAPMENAINGMAGAINSIKEGNEQGYQRAFDSFKENVKLADQRFKTQHELYSDALSLGSADMAASQAKFQNAATRFGDRKALMLMDAGMYPELYELIQSRESAHEQMMKSADAMDLRSVQKAAVNAIKMNPPQTGDPMQDKIQMAAQIQRVYDGGGKYGTAEQEAVGRYVNDPANMKKSPQEFADGLAKLHEKFTPKAVNTEGYRAWLQAYVESHNGEYPPAEEDSKKMQEFGLTYRGSSAGAGGGQSSQARKTRAIEEIQEKHKADGKPISMAEAEREFNKTVQIPSAHDVFQSDIQYDKVERMKDGVNKVEDLLAKHKFITGVGGTITRPVEVIGNILGSNETDRKQFERDVLEIKELGQSALFDRSGRPLSSEAADAGKIFAGLKAGDTTANTLRAYLELRPVLEKVQAQIKARGAGKGPVSGGGSEAPPTGEEPKADWLSAYPEKK